MKNRTFKQLRAWAKETWDKLEKCGCGEPMPEKKHRWHANDWDGIEYCSEHCATKAAEWEAEEDAKLREEERLANANCEFKRMDNSEWLCTEHDCLMIGKQEPNYCSKFENAEAKADEI